MTVLNESAINGVDKFIGLLEGHCAVPGDLKSEIIRHLKGEGQKTHELENRWYASLAEGEPDYSVYEEPYYFADIWACWALYSRKYLLEIQRKIAPNIKRAEAVLDLGCGFGYTTRALAEIFPDAVVTGTNIENTEQFRVASALGKDYGFQISETYAGTDADLLFASEYFEHFLEPLKHLIEILKETKPKYILFANTFSSPAIGHFTEYRHDGRAFTGKQISRMFAQTLKFYGFAPQKTGCWNNKPAYWKR